MGARLEAAGYHNVYEPDAIVTTIESNGVFKVLERFYRWASGDAPFHFRDYARQVWFAVKVRVVRDLRSGDVGCAFISFLLPHYVAVRRIRAARRQKEASHVRTAGQGL